MAEDKKVNIHKGHRQKVKERYFETGLAGMPDHNVLEMLLFFGIPQKDTNEMAHELIEKFGSFSAVLEAKKAELMEVKGMTENAACLITLYLPVYKRYVEDLNRKRPTMLNRKDYIKYLKNLYLDSPNNERVYILCLDSNNKLVACRKISEGDYASTLFDIRKIMSVVLETNAKKVIISHNHPNGQLDPSMDDCSITEDLYNVLTYLKVKLVDHVIITDTSYCSMSASAAYAHYITGQSRHSLGNY